MPAGEKRGNDDEFDIAVNNYCANSQLLMPGEIFQEGELPVLEETDVHGEIGGVRELIREYIIHVREASSPRSVTTTGRSPATTGIRLCIRRPSKCLPQASWTLPTP